ncbi:helix-turn-helix transcriptional regulator [Rhodococcus opacus]|uniref:helix-turn-helix domain-containing protein n=1 Tax=Rhodococcus opacus TaxID=37919 RepID=UPI0009E9B969
MSRWGSFISSHLATNGWSQNRLAKDTGINASVISRWINDGMEPGVKSIRLVAEAFGVPVTRALLAAGAVTADELGILPVVAPDPDLLTDDELVRQLDRRLRQRQAEPAPLPPLEPIYPPEEKPRQRTPGTPFRASSGLRAPGR